MSKNDYSQNAQNNEKQQDKTGSQNAQNNNQKNNA